MCAETTNAKRSEGKGFEKAQGKGVPFSLRRLHAAGGHFLVIGPQSLTADIARHRDLYGRCVMSVSFCEPERASILVAAGCIALTCSAGSLDDAAGVFRRRLDQTTTISVLAIMMDGVSGDKIESESKKDGNKTTRGPETRESLKSDSAGLN